MAQASTVEQSKIDRERDKYRAMWSHAPYRKFSPGEEYLLWAHQALAPERGASFIDFGCGTGRAAAALVKLGHQVLGVDIADNCLDPGIRLPLFVGDLARLPALTADYGLCTDVMEHVRPECVDDVLASIARCARTGTFFSIALVPDAFGPATLGEPLHLTVRDPAWWEERLRAHWPHVERQVQGANLLATCRHAPAGFVTNVEVDARCNATNERVIRNIEINTALPGVPWLMARDAHDGAGVMVGGGPSLAGLVEEVRARARGGQTIFALNGAAEFLQAHDITADYQLILDARPENVRFLKARAARRYLIASQCDPSLFDELAGEDVTLFNYVGDPEIQARLPKGKTWTLLSGAYVLGPIAISAACVMGFRRFHLYGYDSSDAPDGAAHAYAQDLTSAEAKRLEVIVEGRTFRCSYAMFKQAELFPAFASMLAEHGCVITVHGDGLLPTVARSMMQQAQRGD